MQGLPDKIQRVIKAFTVLPGVGERTASRYAMYLFYQNNAVKDELGGAIKDLAFGIRLCGECGHLADGEKCMICTDESRDKHLLCVVESPLDVVALERMGGYRGYYHVLHGVISPLSGIGHDDLSIDPLLKRIKSVLAKADREKGVDGDGAHVGLELILATNPSLEGEATASYISQLVKGFSGLRVTRIARGLPMGADLEYADDMTLARALEGRDAYNKLS